MEIIANSEIEMFMWCVGVFIVQQYLYGFVKSRWRSIRLPACIGREFQRKWTWCNRNYYTCTEKHTFTHLLTGLDTHIWLQKCKGEYWWRTVPFYCFCYLPHSFCWHSVKHMCQINIVWIIKYGFACPTMVELENKGILQYIYRMFTIPYFTCPNRLVS